MIRVLDETDRETVLGFLDRDHEFNLIMIYDIANFGLENHGLPFQGRYHGAFRDGELGGVFALFNFGSMFVYAPDPNLMQEIVDYIAAMDTKPSYLIGRNEWVDPILERLIRKGLKPKVSEEQEFMVLARDLFRPRSGPAVRFAELEDLEQLMELNRAFQLEYFGTLTEAEEELGKMAAERMRGAGIAVAEVDGKIVSKVEALVRTGKASLIGGAYTTPEQRGKGFCFACMSLLCESILSDGRKACLSVAKDNLPARRVYTGIGFERLCDYRMAHFA
jgi:predicted GNAT family acetyltransferase